MRNLALIALLTAVPPSVSAQRASQGASYHHPVHSPAIFFADPFYSEALYRDGYPVASPPPVVILQAAPAPAPLPDRPSTPAQPLMIELQGGRYVRVSGEETSTAEISTAGMETKKIDPGIMDGAPASRRSGVALIGTARSTASPEVLPAVLVFRDGHREEVSDYTIAGGILYTRGNFYTDGSWNKKIDLSSLNLPDTIAANQSRNVNFRLPTAPNEVIVRP